MSTSDCLRAAISVAIGVALALALSAAGCSRRDMRDQPRSEPLEASDFFADGLASRPPVRGTVARGELEADRVLATGRSGEQFAESLPLMLNRDLLSRGQGRYNIYCAPCHGRVGDGLGMVVRRGFKQPPSFHLDRLRQAPPGYFFDVITNGFATMPSYASQIAPIDRWAIAAYIRALQLSQNATLEDVPPVERKLLEREAGR